MKTIVEVENLKFRYLKQGSWNLAIDSFQVKAGEKFFLEGPSGSGKSTLLNILTGVLLPQEGEIQVLGKNLKQLSASKRDHFRGLHIGYIFQNFNLIDYLSVKENIFLPLKLNPARGQREENLEQRFQEICAVLGLENDLDKKAYQMSLGGQQRVAAARALLGRPELIIADEPTSSLDEARTGEFIEMLIEQVNRNQGTLIFVSHDMRLKKYFDRSMAITQLSKHLDDRS